jgi:hypothetical protein
LILWVDGDRSAEARPDKYISCRDEMGVAKKKIFYLTLAVQNIILYVKQPKGV